MDLTSLQDKYCAKGDEAIHTKHQKAVGDTLTRDGAPQSDLNTAIQVFDRCRQRAIISNPKTFAFIQKFVNFVDYIASSDGITVDGE